MLIYFSYFQEILLSQPAIYPSTTTTKYVSTSWYILLFSPLFLQSIEQTHTVVYFCLEQEQCKYLTPLTDKWTFLFILRGYKQTMQEAMPSLIITNRYTGALNELLGAVQVKLFHCIASHPWVGVAERVRASILDTSVGVCVFSKWVAAQLCSTKPNAMFLVQPHCASLLLLVQPHYASLLLSDFFQCFLFFFILTLRQ